MPYFSFKVRWTSLSLYYRRADYRALYRAYFYLPPRAIVGTYFLSMILFFAAARRQAGVFNI